MAITVLSGHATNVTHGSDVSYAATTNGPMAIKNQLINLRLDNKPVLFRTRTLPSIGDGDVVVAAVASKNGTMEALALRNMTTGAIHHAPTVGAMILAGILILIGLPLIAFLGLGLLFVGFGAFVLYKGLMVRKAAAMVRDFQPVA